jgi:hypothetical protein
MNYYLLCFIGNCRALERRDLGVQKAQTKGQKILLYVRNFTAIIGYNVENERGLPFVRMRGNELEFCV